MHEIEWLVINFLVAGFFFVAGMIALAVAVTSLKRQLRQVRMLVETAIGEMGGIRRAVQGLEKTVEERLPVSEARAEAAAPTAEGPAGAADVAASRPQAAAVSAEIDRRPAEPASPAATQGRKERVVDAELVEAGAAGEQAAHEPGRQPGAGPAGERLAAAFGGEPPGGSEAKAGGTPWEPERPRREPSQFERAAWEIARRCWNWLIVGEEYRRKDVAMEFAVASTWLLRLGVLVLLVGVGFFLKYSVERDLIGPLGRVILTAAAGLASMTVGARLLGGKYNLLGHGLLGVGIASEYFAAFAACNFHHLVSVQVAFMLMLGVTVLAGALAVTFDALHIAVLGVVGGYLTPVLLSTGEPSFVGLFAYLTVLGTGVLGIGFYKRWHVLLWLALFANYAIAFSAVREQYRPEFFWQVLPFLCVLFVLFSTSAFLFHVVHRVASTLLELLALTFNALMFFYLGYEVIEAAYGRPWVGALTASLAVFYTLHCYVFLSARDPDRGLVGTFLALASFFVAVTMPLVLAKSWVTAAWAVQALIMLWLSGRLRTRFLQALAILVYGLVTVRMVVTDIPAHFYTPGGPSPVAEFWKAFVERVVAFGVPIACFGLAARLSLPSVPRLREGAGEPEEGGGGLPWAGVTLLLLSLVLAFVYLHHELSFMFGELFAPLRLPVLTVLWAALAVGLLLVYLRRPTDWLLFAAALVLVVALGKLVMWDVRSWGVRGWVYSGDYDPVQALARLVDYAALMGLCVFGYLGLRHAAAVSDTAVQLRRVFAVVGTVLLFVYLTLETNTFLNTFLPGIRQGGITILWTLFGLGLLAVGLGRDIRAARLTALGLFAVVAWKIFFVDLRHLQQLYRVIAFLLLGVLTLFGAFLYLKFDVLFRSGRRQIAGDAPEEGNEARAG